MIEFYYRENTYVNVLSIIVAECDPLSPLVVGLEYVALIVHEHDVCEPEHEEGDGEDGPHFPVVGPRNHRDREEYNEEPY